MARQGDTEHLTASALRGEFFEQLPDEARTMLLSKGDLFEVEIGQVFFRATDPRPRAAIVVAGMVRTFLGAADGRQFSLRYARAGELVGNVAGEAGRRAPLSVQAVSHASLWELDLTTLADLVSSDVRVAAALVAEITRRLQDSYATLAAHAFGSMRERVSRHLLDLGVESTNDGRLLAHVTQQQLADSVGSRREVVARLLRDLRAEGLIVTGEGAIELTDPAKLASIAGRWRAGP